jgi:hypothetical protein
MQAENIQKTDKKAMYSIGEYQGVKKWCFAIVLNRACDNYEDNPRLFYESLLVFERTNRKDWFDEETRQKINEAVQNGTVKKRLTDLRNYFSHYYHSDIPVSFAPDDPVKKIIDKSYEKAKEEVIKHLKKETDIEFPGLFDSSGRITSAGVVFLSSFFVERRVLSRLMGYVRGFKKSEGEYKITRKIFSKYCLRDSYSIHAPDPKAVLFRDILGYLSRVPSKYYPTYLSRIPQGRPGEIRGNEKKYSERKTDKFISFALKYLEEFVLTALKGYVVFIARMEVVREEAKQDEDKGEQYKPYPNQGRIKVIFDSNRKELPYYINHNTVILRIQKTGGTTHSCKIGVNDLKYLVLLCLQGKTDKAKDAIYNYLYAMQDPAEVVKTGTEGKLFQGLPEFILKGSGITDEDKEKEKVARLKYIREKWTKKRQESYETELHRKGRDILRYINWHCERTLEVDKYNQLLTFLVNKDFAGFGVQLNELKRREKISEDVLKPLKGFSSLNELHIKVCDLVLAELEHLERSNPEKLAEYIGLVPEKTDKEPPSYKDKVKAFIEQPMIYKGYLRDTFFQQDRKTFAKLVEETLLQKFRYPDVPLGKEYYHVLALDRFHKDNSILYETLAQDRLCTIMARVCLLQVNKNLAQKAEEIEWRKENGKDIILLKLHRPDSPQETFTICFKVNDFTKLYVMDDPKFLAGLMKYFFPQEKSIEYHRLYSDGINHYTELQRQGITAILAMEEKIIRDRKIPTSQKWIGFRLILENTNYTKDEKESLGRVRNALLHYNLDFMINQFRTFSRIVKTEGFDRDWNIKV